MKIELAKLTLRNFKGQEFIEVNFGKSTTISGDNGTGKTTFLDGFMWLLFDKNSQGETQFDIKNTVKKKLNKINHEVIGEFIVDGNPLVLKKVFNEKWTTRRGESVPVFDGHTTEYFWNDVPVSLSDYKKRVSDLINENIFKMVTSPIYFNNEMKWQDRRLILITIAGNVSDSSERFMEEIATTDAFKKLLMAISNKPIDDYRKELAAKRRKIKEQIDLIPARIDEVKRQFPSEEPDYDDVLLQIGTLNREISELDAKIADISKANESENTRKMAVQNEIHRINTKIFELESEAKRKAKEQTDAQSNANTLATKQRELDSILFKNEHLSGQIKWHDDEIAKLTEVNSQLRGKYAEEDAKAFTFDSLATICPTCEENLPQNKIIKLQENFTRNFLAEKKTVLDSIKSQGLNNNTLIESLNVKKDVFSKELESNILAASKLKEELEVIVAAIENVEIIPFESLLTEEHKSLSIEVYRLQESLKQFTETTTSSSELVEQRNTKSNLIPDLKVKLSVKDSIQKSNDRIKELETEQRTLAQEMADIEQMEFTAQDFVKKKVSLVEDKVNSMFSMVRFRMFDTQVNGQEVECCDCIIEGVPWKSKNSGHQVRAGIDIINTLSKHYNFFAPIWIDNRESTTSIPETESQVINLTVVAGQKLTVA